MAGEKINHAFHHVMGGAKESIGKVVGNEHLAASGAAEKAEADARAAAFHSKQQAQGHVDNISGQTKSTVGAATGNTSLEAEGKAQQASGEVRKTVN